ncbi:reverse transcriptase domain-containing protein [Tanacetum coccineum]
MTRYLEPWFDAIAWWIDSDATTHVCKDRCWFKTYEPVVDGSVLYMGDDHFAPVHGKRNMVLEFISEKSITLFNVSYVPKLHKNLISGLDSVTITLFDAIAWWIDSGATTHVCKDRCWFKTYEPVVDGSVLYMGDDHFSPVHGKRSGCWNIFQQNLLLCLMCSLREFCDKNYNQLLPILAEKMHQEKVQQEKLKAVKARLNFEETSQHSESGAPSRRRNVRKRLRPKDVRSMSRSPEPRPDRSRSPRRKDQEREMVFRRLEKGVFHRLGDKEKESEESAGGHWKSKSKKQRSSMEDDDLSQPWVCEETDPFTHHIRYFDLPMRIRMPSHVKTYDESEDPEDHLKIFQAAAMVEWWAMPTWCHMFNSTLIGNARVWFDDLLSESIDSYDDLKEAFLANYLQQKKCIKDPIESRDVKGAPKVMKISGFMHGITTPELIKRLHDNIPKSIDEMWKITKAFLRGEVAAGNQERKKTFPPWKQQDVGHKQNFKKGGFKNQQREVGHTTDECMHLKRQIEEMLMAGKLSHLIKELKQYNGKNQAKVAKKGEAAGKDKQLAILMGKKNERKGMVIEAEVGGHLVYRMYMDGGASSKILYEHCFNQLRLKIRNQMVPATTYLVGFSEEIIWPLRQVSLLVKISNEEHSTSAWMNFMVVRSHSPYNGIIGRPGVRRIKAIPSTAHRMLKFLVTGGTVMLRSSKIIPLECAMISRPITQQPVVDQVIEEKIQVAIHPEYPEQTIAIGSTLTKEGRMKLCGLLRQNMDIFAWKPEDMTGVPRHIAEHRLSVREGCFPVRQKKRGQAPERNKAICEEVEKLVNADFKDLNKACPKDGYPLPEIDWKVESLCGYPFKCFLDAYKGYHQIKMAKEDEEKTTFITSQRIFCYSKMPFGLKNARATYQRLVDKAF